MWLLKTEPSDYSYDKLEKAGRARWDGVRNPAAIRNLGAMKAGERVLVYHTGDEKAVIGEAEVVREAYPDPKYPEGKLLVVDIEAGRMKLRRTYALAPEGRQLIVTTTAGGNEGMRGRSLRRVYEPMMYGPAGSD